MGDLKEDGDRKVVVCASCRTASCWHGEFMCDDAHEADVTTLTVRELLELKLEHPDNFSVEKVRAVCGT